MADRSQALAQLAKTAASVEELTREAKLWLFARKHLLPGERVQRDAARAAFAAYEIAALAVVRAEIPAPALKKAIAAVFAKRKGGGDGTVLEWLRITPIARWSPLFDEALDRPPAERSVRRQVAAS